jgi:hypothetical protein
MSPRQAAREYASLLRREAWREAYVAELREKLIRARVRLLEAQAGLAALRATLDPCRHERAFRQESAAPRQPGRRLAAAAPRRRRGVR